MYAIHRHAQSVACAFPTPQFHTTIPSIYFVSLAAMSLQSVHRLTVSLSIYPPRRAVSVCAHYLLRVSGLRVAAKRLVATGYSSPRFHTPQWSDSFFTPRPFPSHPIHSARLRSLNEIAASVGTRDRGNLHLILIAPPCGLSRPSGVDPSA